MSVPPKIKKATSVALAERRLVQLKRKELQLLEQQAKVRSELPHLYGQPWYRWAKAFFESRNRQNFLCAANQLSKSSTQIRKMIHWATEPKLWPELWPENPKPSQFWYMYPNHEVASSEFNTKWEPEFLPRGDMKNHPQYGWKAEWEKRIIKAIHFNSGVSVYFKGYSQNATALQTATVFAVFTDEEMPANLYDEVLARLRANRGYFHMVFTATLGQEFWWRVIEGTGEAELFPDAFKQQISMYDSQFYIDGSPSKWTDERIAEEKALCKSKAEIDRRIYGRFVKDEGLKYPTFEPHRHYIQPKPVDPNWRVYAGIDIGSGGTNHPSAISFVAVSPDGRSGEVIDGWRGDGMVTTVGDVLEKYMSMARGYKIVRAVFDPRAVDFGIMAARAGVGVEKADTRHETGAQNINTLFKNDMLFIHDTAELRKLGSELNSVPEGDYKSKKYLKDDFADSLRYCCASIPWDWEAVSDRVNGPTPLVAGVDRPLTPQEEYADEVRRRRGEFIDDKKDDWREHYALIEEWNNYYEGS